ncbi:hypothetical protein SLS53_006315 [Cytospora paraplurivora]|uniref:Uncharacterized protein n=1 Tax=Cytospora paraplurivora TaxID=2898453 RepID=A0AAN9YE85_9PEZI
MVILPRSVSTIVARALEEEEDDVRAHLVTDAQRALRLFRQRGSGSSSGGGAASTSAGALPSAGAAADADFQDEFLELMRRGVAALEQIARSGRSVGSQIEEGRDEDSEEERNIKIDLD